MPNHKPPAGLGDAGRALWSDVTSEHELDAVQRLTLTQACRCADRLDKLDLILSGDADAWAKIKQADGELVLKIDGALAASNTTTNLLKQLVASLRLPDAGGKRQQRRGAARGAHQPKGSAPRVSSLEAARQAAAG